MTSYKYFKPCYNSLQSLFLNYAHECEFEPVLRDSRYVSECDLLENLSLHSRVFIPTGGLTSEQEDMFEEIDRSLIAKSAKREFATLASVYVLVLTVRLQHRLPRTRSEC